MKNVRRSFEKFEGNKEDLPIGFQQITCYMIFNIKLGEIFQRKARLVGGEHQTVAPTSITYFSVLSRDSVKIALTVPALNDLDKTCMQYQKCLLN